nr:putative ribonuclease H-like domain-containing protein [Tanacetum cinerariifolium]
MTGNKSYLTDYQEIDGGFVAFGGNAKGGKITSKGKIRTGKLDFEDVYFVKELKFNLFSISQMCDKKNNVLFTNTECVVLSPDFKLLDESQVLLRVPRNNNMYSFDLKNVVPVGGYSINSKAFRVFNTRTRFVEENLHITFLENKPNVAGIRPNWMFDIDTLTMSMNSLVFAGNQTNGNACTKANINAGKARKKTVFGPQYNRVQDLAKEGNNNNQEKDLRDQEEVLRKQFEQESKRLFGQREATNTNNTNRLNTVSLPVNTVSSSFTTADPGRERAQMNEFENVFGQDKDANDNNTYRMFTPVSDDGSSYVNLGGSILDTGIFSGAYDDEVKGAEVGFNNLELTTFKVWRLVDLPKGKHAIGTKWVYRNKKDKRCIVVRNKERLVVQGYTQEKGIDYDEVFALVAKVEAIKLFLAYALFMGFLVYQMDVKSAFLYGTIEEEVYVCQPLGFEDSHFPDKVYKVEKALYGLHQAPRAWYDTLSTYLLENRFRKRIIDKTLFIKKDIDDILLVHVYVDDIIFGSTKKSLCKEFEGLMHKKLQMSSIKKLTLFLGLQVM